LRILFRGEERSAILLLFSTPSQTLSWQPKEDMTGTHSVRLPLHERLSSLLAGPLQGSSAAAAVALGTGPAVSLKQGEKKILSEIAEELSESVVNLWNMLGKENETDGHYFNGFSTLYFLLSSSFYRIGEYFGRLELCSFSFDSRHFAKSSSENRLPCFSPTGKLFFCFGKEKRHL